MLNRVTIIGNLGNDPEMRQTQNGVAVGNFSVACTEKRKQGDDWVDHTEWVNVVVWQKTAENCGKYLTKGKRVYVEGKLQTSTWEHEGKKHYKTEVVAQAVKFLSPVEGGQSSQNGGQAGFAPKPQGEFDNIGTPGASSGNIPF